MRTNKNKTENKNICNREIYIDDRILINEILGLQKQRNYHNKYGGLSRYQLEY